MIKDKMKIQIIEKAWRVNKDKFEEPWYHGDQIYYGTRGKAKSSSISDNDAGKLLNGKEINFINIPIIRAKEYDKVLFNNEVIKRYQIKQKLREQKIKELPKDKLFYVQDSRQYVGNAVVWWELNGNGYTTDISKAQIYTYEQIQKFQLRETDIIWESTHVENAIRIYVDMQGLNRDKSI